MNHRERVIAALNHEQPDRCPMQVSFTPEFAERLRLDPQIRSNKVHNPQGGGNTYALERAAGEDLLLTPVGRANSYYQAPGDYVDEWGVGFRSVPYATHFGTGRYTETASRRDDKEYQPTPQGGVSHRWLRLPNYSRANRDWSGCAKPDSAGIHGPGAVEARVWPPAVLLGGQSMNSGHCHLAVRMMCRGKCSVGCARSARVAD